MMMKNLDEIIEGIHQTFDATTQTRDQALSHARMLTRHCAQAIRAIHRDEDHLVDENLTEAARLVNELVANQNEYPALYYTGYTQDALKEYAEAKITRAIVHHEALPTPEELKLEHATYLKGMAEAAGELRRRCMDILRHNHTEEAEYLLDCMDEIYAVLVTMDYPDAITGGLRRLTDIVRGVTERTRGDLSISLRQEQLEISLRRLEERL